MCKTKHLGRLIIFIGSRHLFQMLTSNSKNYECLQKWLVWPISLGSLYSSLFFLILHCSNYYMICSFIWILLNGTNMNDFAIVVSVQLLTAF